MGRIRVSFLHHNIILERVEWIGMNQSHIVLFFSGSFRCTDLFDTDMSAEHPYDSNVPAGADEDDWPFINIYGSCKTCEAYVLDYFAEESFEKLDDYFLQAMAFLGLSTCGFLLSILGFIKYKVSPTAENRVELLGSDGGVLA